MHFANRFGLLACVFVLVGRKCAAERSRGQRESGQYVTRTKVSSVGCRDIVDIAYCRQVKEKNLCNFPTSKKRCKNTCGVCTSGKTESLPQIPEYKTDTQVCRDIGTLEFCTSIKPACARLGYSSHTKARYASRYCRKTCGLCTPKVEKKPENTCVDRPICEMLTKYYKITQCLTLPSTLRKRALRKCPKLCGTCVSGETETKEEVATLKRPMAADIVDAPKVKPQKKKAYHPPVNKEEQRDDKPRSGIFYIYTKYLSL